ncbi:hypothetical protein PFISCL1PPCAC_22238, partial [Pristionchus fissidentatus]
SEFIPSTAWEFMPVGGKRIPLKELTPCWPLGTPYSIHDDPPLIGLQGNQPVIVEPNGQAKITQPFRGKCTFERVTTRVTRESSPRTISVFYNKRDVCVCVFSYTDKLDLINRPGTIDSDIIECFIDENYVGVLTQTRLIVVNVDDLLNVEHLPMLDNTVIDVSNFPTKIDDGQIGRITA